MSEQKTISQAVKEEFLGLTRWANNMIRQLQANFETQHVWPGGFPGPYIGYRNTPAAKKAPDRLTVACMPRCSMGPEVTQRRFPSSSTITCISWIWVSVRDSQSKMWNAARMPVSTSFIRYGKKKATASHDLSLPWRCVTSSGDWKCSCLPIIRTSSKTAYWFLFRTSLNEVIINSG